MHSSEVLHNRAVKFWSKVRFDKMDNSEIHQKYNISYNSIVQNRAIYASETLGERIEWKPKVERLVSREQDFIVANSFPQQAAARNAAYWMGIRLHQEKPNKKKDFIRLYMAR